MAAQHNNIFTNKIIWMAGAADTRLASTINYNYQQIPAIYTRQSLLASKISYSWLCTHYFTEPKGEFRTLFGTPDSHQVYNANLIIDTYENTKNK